ncbi:hypothetical protein HFQ13_06560 [Acidithiobacillus sp. VAN18-1]|uniref:Uncharacterized protein n=1 Tax=Igneacidithiobacillus copahuensis TaxID=2724909 RepID=A0AAE3CJJ9_9PROT|nr:hypothetical protein [Igneacidithiobacillus copahuensis]MBU2787866.1 hypothetical protein [Igneacidithiobacillus copahuensis]MBU2795482.1 hypothetical protein [Acidithiobacillus sp. VAN18-2]
MKKVAQSVLPFKLAATDELMTAQAGLVLHGEFISIIFEKTRGFAEKVSKMG